MNPTNPIDPRPAALPTLGRPRCVKTSMTVPSGAARVAVSPSLFQIGPSDCQYRTICCLGSARSTPRPLSSSTEYPGLRGREGKVYRWP
jgi:hypothetical protein